MFIYVGKTFTASVEGRRLEEVRCAKCRTRYFYQLVRVGTGKASAPYYLGQASAARRAEAAAQKDVGKRLAREAEMVPCPKCHWVNEELVARYRKRRYRGGTALAVFLALPGVVAAPIVSMVVSESYRYDSTVPATAAALTAGGGLALAALVLLVRRTMRLRIDPNATYPRRPELPVGTPPPLVERADPQTGDTMLVPAPVATDDGAAGRPGRAEAQWAVFRPGQALLPPVCCVCLAPDAAGSYKPPFTVNQNTELDVPLCRPCASRLRARWWLIALAVSAAVLGAGALTALSLRGIDEIGQWMTFILFAIFGVPFAVAIIPTRLCRPYKYGVVDADRGIVKFAAQNPGYTELLIRQARAHDGLGG